MTNTYIGLPRQTGGASASNVRIFDENGNPFSTSNPLDVTANFTGLRIGGRITEVSINSTTWTALPASPLANRNAIAIHNPSGTTEAKINYSNSVAGYVGMPIKPEGERAYDITDAIVIYAKSQSGTMTLYVEEIA